MDRTTQLTCQSKGQKRPPPRAQANPPDADGPTTSQLRVRVGTLKLRASFLSFKMTPRVFTGVTTILLCTVQSTIYMCDPYV